MRKSPKNRLGRSPLGTPLGYQAGTASSLYFGPSPLLWLLPLPPYQATLGSWPYGWVFSTPGPLLEKRLFPAADGQAPGSRKRLQTTRQRPWRGSGAPFVWLCLCKERLLSWIGTEPGPDIDLTHHQTRTPRGVLRGESPKRFFPRFLIVEKSGPAERPTRLASLRQANDERQKQKHHPAEQTKAKGPCQANDKKGKAPKTAQSKTSPSGASHQAGKPAPGKR